jgi:sulfite exporter TauE/SafE/plastocyanin domain-containing protein/copper chaperone CopZ
MSQTNKKIMVPIKGMHCKSCELLVEDGLKEVRSVVRSKADWHHSYVDVYYEGEAAPIQQITEAINQAGYSVGADEEQASGWFSRNKTDWQDLGIAALFLLGIYFMLKGLGLTNLNFNAAADNLTLPVVMLVGLTAGFSTCMAMVGGLVLGISARHAAKHPEATPAQKMRPHLFFNLGRITAFALLGGVLGMVGSVFQLSGVALGAMTLLVGAVMLVMGLQLIGIFPWADKFKLTLPKSLSRVLGVGQHQKEYNHRGAMIMGALTFFLPCGFTQAMQVYAISSGSFASGAIIMAGFAIGTLPGMLSIGGLTSVLKGVFAKRFFKLAGLAVLIFAFLNISNGLNLTGWNNLAYGKTTSAGININDPNVTLVNGVQVVQMKETSQGYEPNSFTIKKDVPVKWEIDAQAPYSCASTILLNQFNIRRNLTAGANTIEFTPTEAGQLRFSCSMGMYTGVCNVVDTTATAAGAGPNSQTAACSNVTSGTTCGVGGSSATVGTGGGCGAAANNNAASSPNQAPVGGSCGGGGGCGCGGGAKPYVPTTENTPSPTGPRTANQDNQPARVITSSFTLSNDIQPNTFTVKAGTLVKYIVNPTEDGRGCMSTIMIQTLYPNPVYIQANKPIEMDFTPETPGTYLITCAMNVPRGKIIVQ